MIIPFHLNLGFLYGIPLSHQRYLYGIPDGPQPSSAQMSFLGAGIFCAYLVYDTWRIATVLKVDDYVEGAIQFQDAVPSLGVMVEQWLRDTSG